MISQQTIDTVRDTLVKEFNPLEIYLFGSYAWGHPTDESDLDLLVVVDQSYDNANWHNVLVNGYRALSGIRVSKDLLVCTKDEFEQGADDDVSRLNYKIKQQGRKLYARA
jgi:predicted nucleotidyltransferase